MMNPFERFLGIKDHLLEDPTINSNLEKFVSYQCNELRRPNLHFLGAGQLHAHFRIGKFDDLYLATREVIHHSLPMRQAVDCAYYIQRLVYAFNSKKDVPQIVGGVRTFNKQDNYWRFFLIVEDLTRGGNSKFVPGQSGELVSGLVDGRPVYYDFEEVKYPECLRSTVAEYMKRNQMLLFGKK